MSHHCHAQGCDITVPPRLLMCARHWRMVPKPLQDRVWATYRRGQEITKDPTPEYMDAQRAAVEAVAEKERHIEAAAPILALLREGAAPSESLGRKATALACCVRVAGLERSVAAEQRVEELEAQVKSLKESEVSRLIGGSY